MPSFRIASGQRSAGLEVYCHVGPSVFVDSSPTPPQSIRVCNLTAVAFPTPPFLRPVSIVPYAPPPHLSRTCARDCGVRLHKAHHACLVTRRSSRSLLLLPPHPSPSPCPVTTPHISQPHICPPPPISSVSSLRCSVLQKPHTIFTEQQRQHTPRKHPIHPILPLSHPPPHLPPSGHCTRQSRNAGHYVPGACCGACRRGRRCERASCRLAATGGACCKPDDDAHGGQGCAGMLSLSHVASSFHPPTHSHSCCRSSWLHSRRCPSTPSHSSVRCGSCGNASASPSKETPRAVAAAAAAATAAAATCAGGVTLAGDAGAPPPPTAATAETAGARADVGEAADTAGTGTGSGTGTTTGAGTTTGGGGVPAPTAATATTPVTGAGGAAAAAAEGGGTEIGGTAAGTAARPHSRLPRCRDTAARSDRSTATTTPQGPHRQTRPPPRRRSRCSAPACPPPLSPSPLPTPLSADKALTHEAFQQVLSASTPPPPFLPHLSPPSGRPALHRHTGTR